MDHLLGKAKTMKTCLIICVVLLVAGFLRAETEVSVSPAVVVVEPGAVFTVDVWKDSADIEFDGYETVICFDPAMLEFISVSEGTVMTNVCTNRWWNTKPGVDSVFISHVLMCGGLTATGPGALSSLQFRSLDEGITTIWSTYFWFTKAGVWDRNVQWHDGYVVIGDQTGMADDRAPAGPVLTVCRNPAPEFRIGIGWRPPLLNRSEAALYVCDVTGHLVRRLWSGLPSVHTTWVEWDGQDEEGNCVSPGIYFVVLSGEAAYASAKVVLIE